MYIYIHMSNFLVACYNVYVQIHQVLCGRIFMKQIKIHIHFKSFYGGMLKCICIYIILLNRFMMSS